MQAKLPKLSPTDRTGSLEVRDLKGQYFDTLSEKEQRSSTENSPEKIESIKWKDFLKKL